MLVELVGMERVPRPDVKRPGRWIECGRRPDSCTTLRGLLGRLLNCVDLLDDASGVGSACLDEYVGALERVALTFTSQLSRAAGNALEQHTVRNNRAGVGVCTGLGVGHGRPLDLSGLLVQGGDLEFYGQSN